MHMYIPTIPYIQMNVNVDFYLETVKRGVASGFDLGNLNLQMSMLGDYGTGYCNACMHARRWLAIWKPDLRVYDIDAALFGG